ncbi:cytochrome P450 [Xylariomycetidae sp. FL2044]|nr:cytochrome P450 [Xylariomycetidae sp. FL2044]
MASVNLSGALLVSVMVVYILFLCVQRLFFHPLRKTPGPFIARVSNIYLGFFALAQRIHLKTHENHLRYDIYQNDQFVKSSNYRAAQHRPEVHNVFTVLERASHRSKRRLIGQVVSERSMRVFEPTMLGQVDVFLREIRKTCTRSSPIDMTPACRNLGYDTVALLSFGSELNLQADPAYRFLPKAISLGDFRINVCMHFPPLLTWRLHQRIADGLPNSLRDKFFALLDKLITERFAQPADAKHDLYSMMTKSLGSEPSRLDLVTEAAFFFPAGAETIVASLSAGFFYLSRNPECYRRLAAEIRSAFGSGGEIKSGTRLASCKYLRACIDETLRMSPPVPGTLWRELAAGDGNSPLMIDDHVIYPGTQVGVNIYSLHHNEQYFPDSFTYRPERWLECDDTKKTVMHDAFAAFSVGPRGCAGKAMAYLEISVVLAKTLWYFDFEPAPGGLGHLGGGGLGRTDGRDRIQEYQLYDRFAADHRGPHLVFHPRPGAWDGLN